MITYVKTAIAKAIKAGLKQQVRIRTSDFDGEGRDGRPVPLIEVSVIYSGSTYNTLDPLQFQPRVGAIVNGWRSLAFNIFIRAKNLRTEDLIQDLTDSVIDILNGTVIFQQPLLVTSDQALGNEDSIWTYQLGVSLTVPLGAESCETDWENMQLETIVVKLHVRDTPDDLQVLIVELKPDAAKG